MAAQDTYDDMDSWGLDARQRARHLRIVSLYHAQWARRHADLAIMYSRRSEQVGKLAALLLVMSAVCYLISFVASILGGS